MKNLSMQQVHELYLQGRVKILPCPEGAEVYKITIQTNNFDDSPYLIVTREYFRMDMLDKLGKTIFLNEADAEKKRLELEKQYM